MLAAVLIGVTACGFGGSSSGNPNAAAPASSAQPSSGASDTTVAGDIPDNQVYVAFTPATGGYVIKVPEGWSRTSAGSSVTFTDRFNSIRVETQPAAKAPTAATAAGTEAASLRSAVPGFSLGDVSTVHRAAGDAVLVKYQATSPPEQVTGKTVQLSAERYEFWRGGVEAIVTVSAPAGADNVDPWKTVTDSFGWR